MPDMTIESLARITASARLSERLRVADLLTNRADVRRGEGEFEIATDLDIIAGELRGGGQIRVAPITPPAPASPFGAALGESAALPEVQFNSDEEDGMRHLRALGARGAAGSNLMRD